MSLSEEKAIPFIQFENEKLISYEEATAFLQLITTPFGIVAINGHLGNGNSFKFNQINQNHSYGFATSTALNSGIKGAWILNHSVLEYHLEENFNVNLSVRNPKEFYSKNSNYYPIHNLICLGKFLSPFKIDTFNKETYKNREEHLAFFNYMNKKSISKIMNISNKQYEYSKAFIWMLCNLTLFLINEDETTISSKGYHLENASSHQESQIQTNENKKIQRKMLKDLFRSYDFFIQEGLHQ